MWCTDRQTDGDMNTVSAETIHYVTVEPCASKQGIISFRTILLQDIILRPGYVEVKHVMLPA